MEGIGHTHAKAGVGGGGGPGELGEGQLGKGDGGGLEVHLSVGETVLLDRLHGGVAGHVHVLRHPQD